MDLSYDEFYKRMLAEVSIYPGIKIDDAQSYTLTWGFKTVFFTHNEETDKINFTSSDLEADEKYEIELFFRNYLTNQNYVLY